MGTARLDMERRVLRLADGREAALTASEFDLLRLFVLHPNRPLTREWLLEAAAHREAEPLDRAIDNRVMRLRRKVERDPAKPEALRAVRGVGYIFVPPRDRAGRRPSPRGGGRGRRPVLVTAARRA